MLYLYKIIFYEPILKVLIFIYDNLAFQNFGLALVILTIFIRLLLFPLFYKSAKHTTIIQKLQPQISKIQKDLKHNKEAQTKELLSLYKTHKINPFSGLFLIVLQLPVLIALYQVILKEISNFDNFIFLSFFNLKEKSLIIAFLAALLQYYQIKLSISKNNDSMSNQVSINSNKILLFIGPVMSLVILSSLPAALGIYWLTSTIFSLFQQIIINKHLYGKNNRENRNID